MAWQIQCKQHFLKQLYTLNNQLDSEEETLTWHEDEQIYCWDCMRVRGAMFCCWCMRVYESCMMFCESCWERFCDRSCWRCELCEAVKIFSESCVRGCVRGCVLCTFKMTWPTQKQRLDGTPKGDQKYNTVAGQLCTKTQTWWTWWHAQKRPKIQHSSWSA